MILIGTSGWHYSDWIDTFYPLEYTGYQLGKSLYTSFLLFVVSNEKK